MKILRSIKGKLILFTLCISLIPISIITTIYYLNARSALKKQILRELTAIAESKKLHVETFLNAIKARTADFSSDGFIRDSLNKINHEGLLKQDAVINLNKHLKDNKLPLDPDIAAITILDKAGMVVASTVESTIGKDFSDYEEYVHVIDKDINKVFIHPPHFSGYLGQNVMEVAAPIISMESGESIGVIMNTYALASLNDITANRVGMGETGEVYIVNNRYKIMLTESRFIEDVVLKLVVDTEPVRRINEGGKGMTGIYPDYRGVPIVGASVDIPEYGWMLLAEIDKAEALAPLKTLGIVALVLGGVCAAVAVCGGIIFSVSAARPISRLKDATDRFAKGDMDYRVNLANKDEIGQLAISFNEMVDNLQESNSALHESEEMFRTINASANDAIITIDNEGKVLFWNKAAEKMFSYSSKEIVGRSLYKSIVPVKYHERYLRGFRRFQDTGQGLYIGKTVELTAINRDGKEFPIEHSISAVKIKGKWNGIGIIRDITERKKAENELHTKNSYLKLLQVAAVAANEAVDIKDAFQPVLEEICSYTGWEIGHAYVISKDDPNLLEPTSVWRLKDHKHFKEFCDVSKEIKFARGIGLPGRVLASRIPHWIVDVTKDKNFLRAKIAKAVNIKSGIAFPVLVGSKVVAVMTFFTTKALEPDQQLMDIMAEVGTELGRAVERKQAEAQIRKLSRVVEQSPNIVIITDTKGNIEYVNPKFTQTTGYSFEEALNQNPRILKSYRTPQEVYEQLWKTITSGKEWRGEFCNKKKSGELFWESAYILPIKDDEGDINHFVAIKEDITERKKMEEELIKAKKLESVGILAGGIAHDFNNNLQAILSSIILAEACTDSNDKICKILEEAKKVVLRSKNLTRQLLTFSKGGEPIITTISVPELIKDSTNLTLSGSNVRSEVDIQDELWPVEADKGQMNQVISNLVINADQAMPEGGIVRLRAENTNIAAKDSLPIKGRYVKITIGDYGIGISQENLQKIFDPYFTTKKKGSGLGLAITYSIIKKHGGYITVESVIGVGTTFRIYLPASIQKEIRKRSILSKAEGAYPEPVEGDDGEEKPSKTKGKILLMDDEDMIRFVTGEHLRLLKYEVETVEDGTEAIKLYKKAFESGKPFDAVLIDLTIAGGMGGEEAISKLLGIDPNVKAIVLSGYSNDPVMADYIKYGFRDVLAKPYEIQELDETLQKVIMRNEE